MNLNVLFTQISYYLYNKQVFLLIFLDSEGGFYESRNNIG